MRFSREKSQHILALNKGITSLRMLWRRLPILFPPHLTAPHPKTLLADFSREFSEEFLSGTAGWRRRHDSSRGGWCGGWTCWGSPSDTFCSPALHHIWPISAFIHTMGSLNFYIFTLLLYFWLILTPYWPRILSTAAISLLEQQWERFSFTHLITPEMVCLKTSQFSFVSFSISWSSTKLSFAMISLCRRTCQMSGCWPGTKMGQCWRIQTHFSLTLHWRGFLSAGRLTEV